MRISPGPNSPAGSLLQGSTSHDSSTVAPPARRDTSAPLARQPLEPVIRKPRLAGHPTSTPTTKGKGKGKVPARLSEKDPILKAVVSFVVLLSYFFLSLLTRACSFSSKLHGLWLREKLLHDAFLAMLLATFLPLLDKGF